MSALDSRGVVFIPLCQGFLKKKAKMRMRWVTYWFKLHNTTLFFYTKKHGSTVESVHKVMRNENKRYMFEIAMKNGKRKVLYITLDTASSESSQQLGSETEYKSMNMGKIDILPTHKEMMDTIYEVPKSIFRNMHEYVNEASSNRERPKRGDLLSDMTACLGENSAD
ncbi:hypothetical protein P4O66_003603 [Electrophorus voltai]|uniref:PH domain-containing protein n=1 Tax=Electrophorus voltai TaxID=2609070 RepID=A0AAD9E2L0_9TELE|nr:hypothetical protein P4O66_003603 [Electrophorus voltai]